MYLEEKLTEITEMIAEKITNAKNVNRKYTAK